MDSNLKTSFSINDLEILSGIKAHTIRIWEKRYDFLNPERLARNVRKYSVDDLRKMLNTAYLQENGYKISEIATMSDKDLSLECKNHSLKELSYSIDINSMIISMFTLDESLFNSVYNRQMKYRLFTDIYINTFVPLLRRIGMLWQADSIKPAHEHFISALIYQKISIEIAKVGVPKDDDGPVHILFLPENEIHEIGLLFLNYCLRTEGKKTIHLGQSIPVEDLFEISTQFTNIHWVSSLVMTQRPEKVQGFLNKMETLMEHTHNNCSVIGYLANHPERFNVADNINLYPNFESFLNF